jgi:uncharacterized protein DUF6879
MPDVERWLRGEPAIETDDDRAWVDYVRGQHAAGVPFRRVRMLTEPLTDYLRWMLATGRVFTNMAVAIADGGDCVSHIEVFGDRHEVVASMPTTWRLSDRIDRAHLLGCWPRGRRRGSGRGRRVRPPS